MSKITEEIKNSRKIALNIVFEFQTLCFKFKSSIMHILHKSVSISNIKQNIIDDLIEKIRIYSRI